MEVECECVSMFYVEPVYVGRLQRYCWRLEGKAGEDWWGGAEMGLICCKEEVIALWEFIFLVFLSYELNFKNKRLVQKLSYRVGFNSST